jgi:hypothetical protein
MKSIWWKDIYVVSWLTHTHTTHSYDMTHVEGRRHRVYVVTWNLSYDIHDIYVVSWLISARPNHIQSIYVAWRHRVYVVTWNLSGDMTSMWCHDSHTHTQLTHTTSHTWMGDDIESMSWHEISLMTYMTFMWCHDSFPPDPTTYNLCCVTT